jgi:glycosyltransferase involved in cell wall biosynthesis
MPASQYYPGLPIAPRAGRPAPPVRVLLLAPYAPSGGGMGQMMAYLARENAPGLRFVKVETRGGGPASASLWPMLKAASRIVRAALAGPAIVHVNVAEGLSVPRKGALLLLARLCRLPVVLHLHAANIIALHARLPAPARLAMALLFRSATVCIVLGSLWAEWLERTLGVKPDRIETLRNGVPPPAATRNATPRDGTFTLVFIGNLLPRKGLPDLIAALADPRLASGNWRLLVAGGGDENALRRLAAEHGIAGRVQFLGWLERGACTALLAAAGALVLPAYHEALPLVLLEAASLGVPVITTPVGAIADYFADGETALLVPPGDTAALAGALARVMQDQVLAARLSRNGRALYERCFTMAAFSARLREIYQRHCLRPAARRLARAA